MRNKRLDLTFIMIMVATAIACIVHITIAYIATANNLGTSAPPSIAFLLAVPYSLAILIELVVWLIIKRKINRK